MKLLFTKSTTRHVAVCLLVAAAVRADVIDIPPSGVTASTEIPGFDRKAIYLVDGSGLIDGGHTVTPDGFMWLSSGTAFGGDDPDPSVTFDLGEVHTINSFHVWNYNEVAPPFPPRGVNGVTVEYGVTEALGSTVPGITNFEQASGTPGDPGQAFDEFDPFVARYIRFVIHSNHGGDNNFYGLSEVQFDGFPGAILLTSNLVLGSMNEGDVVGSLLNPSGADGDTFDYALVAGEGDVDNDKFEIVGDELRVGAHDFSAAGEGTEYSIRVLATGSPSGDEIASAVRLVASGDADADALPDEWEMRWAEGGSLTVLSGLAGADADGDSLTDLQEYELAVRFPDLDPTSADSDGDGLADPEELEGSGERPATDPTSADTDGDGLSDGAETNTGVYLGPLDTGSDPLEVDTDNDGFGDGFEVEGGSNPLDPNDPAIPVAAVTTSTEIEACCGDRDPIDLTNRSGLAGGLHDVIPGNMWLSEGQGFGAIDPDPWVLFDLGEVYTITGFHVWNYNEIGAFATRGVNSLSIEYGTTEELGSTLAEVTEFAMASGADGDPGEVFDGFAPFAARFIKFDINSNHGDANTFYGLSEVQFKGSLGAGPGLQLELVASGGELTIKWPSKHGMLYNLRSTTDPAGGGDPATWPIYGEQADLEATPEENSLTIPLPADGTRFFVIEEFPKPPTQFFADDFEGGQGGWTVGSDGAGGTAWEFGPPTGSPGIGPATAHGGAACVGTNLAGNYGLDANVWLRTPAIDLSEVGAATLSYFEFRDIEAGFDFGTVRILDSSDDSLIEELAVGVDGVTPDWVSVSEQLPASALGKVIKIEFRLNTDDVENFAGWYLDDFVLTVR